MAKPSFAGELPDLGNASGSVLTAAQEYELGRSVMQELNQAQVLLSDLIVNEYLQGIGYRLIATHGGAQPDYYFFAVKDRSINAFALPGGFVGINTGLILATEGESELAGVIAHEIGHVQQKHIARMYQHMGRLQLSTIAGMIASVIIATQNPQAATGAMAATLAGRQQALINFTRDHEREADYVGIQTLSKAGYDPMGMPAFFHRMQQDTRFYGNFIPEYLLTHPLTETRLMAAQSRAKAFPYKQVADSLQYHLIQARVLAFSFNSSQEAINHFAKKLQRGNYQSQIGTLYGYVLALIEDGKYHEAKPYVEQLLQAYPDHPFFQLAYATIEINTNQTQKALSRLANTLKDHPNNYPLTYTYAEWLVKTKDSATAIQFLKHKVLQKPPRPELLNLLSSAYSQAGQPMQAHLTQAQYLKLRGDLQGAAIQLKIARKLAAPSSQQQKQIDAEIKEIQRKVS
ncbi:MAG: M48 family metalloprotease [Candidatus Berkiellales bacterium]